MAAPTLLRIIHPDDPAPVLPVPIPLIAARAGYEHLTTRERSATTEVATREALLHRLETVGMLAPESPLSFLAVHVHGLGMAESADTASESLAAVANQLVSAVGPFDLVGRFSASAFGVVLQGRAARSTAALAAMLQYRLNRLPELPHPLRVDVYAATGTGANADTLPEAAGDSLPDVS